MSKIKKGYPRQRIARVVRNFQKNVRDGSRFLGHSKTENLKLHKTHPYNTTINLIKSIFF